MSQSLNIKIAGLYTYPSDLSAVPEGALAQADNIVVDRDNVAAPRRGFNYLAHGSGTQTQFSTPTYRAAKLGFYQSQLLAHYGTFGSPTLLGYHNSSTGWVNFSGTYNPPSSTVPMRFVEANKNLYFTTSAGVKKLDTYNGTPRQIGCPQGLDIKLGTSGSNGWLAAGATTAYRLVWCYTDANNNLIQGAPSQRQEITNNTTSLQAITFQSTLPTTINAVTPYFYQVYRAQQTGSSAGYVEPNDELGLVYQAFPNSTDLSNGYVSFTDITPDALAGATIYTAPSQGGIALENYPVPVCNDIAVFRNCMFFANTSTLQTYTLSLLGVGSPNGLVAGNTLVIGGVTFTAAATETIGSGQFAVNPAFILVTTGNTNSNTSLTSMTSVAGITAAIALGQTVYVSGANIPAGTYVTNVSGSTVTISQAATGSASGQAITFTGDSASQAIRDTALSLVRVINQYSSSTTYAYYISGTNSLPGQILITARTVGASAFVLTSSAAATVWSPALPSSGTTQTSTNAVNPNYVYYSQPQQPEAVPLANYFAVGSGDQPIYRILPLRDSLFILKGDGIFRLYGTDPSNFAINPLDYTANILAPESAVVLNNQIYALTSQGVVAIGETGVQLISRPIEDQLTSLQAIDATAGTSLLANTSFGVAYESDRAYLLYVFTGASDTGPTQVFRYNYLTQAWSRWPIAKNCGGVNPANNLLYQGNANLAIIDVERKSLNYSDYADYSSTQTIMSISGTTMTITSSDVLQVGSIIYQSATVFGTVASVNNLTGVVTLAIATALTAGSADVLNPIPCAMEWVPVTLQNPGMTKQLREVSLLFLSDFNGNGYVSFSSDIYPGVLTEQIAGGVVGTWGLSAWGGPGDTALGTPWGGANRRRPIRVSIPRNHQRSSILTLGFTQSYAYSPWLLQGISVIGDIVSERVAK